MDSGLIFHEYCGGEFRNETDRTQNKGDDLYILDFFAATFHSLLCLLSDFECFDWLFSLFEIF